MKTIEFQIAKMDCPTEEQIIRKTLEPMRGVSALRFDLMGRVLTVDHTLDSDAPIERALAELDMGATRLQRAAGARATAAIEPPPAARGAPAALALSGVAAIAAEVAAWITGKESSALVIALAVASITFGGRETLKKGLLALRRFTLNINFLMMLAIAGATAIGQWPEAAMVTFLFALAEVIEARSLDHARNAVRGLMQMTPETANVRRDGAWTEVEAGIVELREIVRVRPGERIPLDGRVTAGASSVNQAPITGESLPVRKEPGDPVFAGTVNEAGVLEFEVTANRGNTTLDRIVRSIQEAQSQRAPTQRFVDRFAKWYTPAVVLIAMAVALVPPLAVGAELRPWLYKALVLLVIACPCALVVSVPVTVVSGLASAAKRGILVKGGAYLEDGRRLRAVALDKTGTLTHGKPAVTEIAAVGDVPPEQLLRIAASIDALSDHPVARAVTERWTSEHGAASLLEVTDFESLTGRGVRGRIDGETYFVGSHRLAEEQTACSPAVEEVLAALEARGETTVVVTTDKAPLGVLGVADTARATSVEAIRRLHALGVSSVMLTGDNVKTGRAIAAQVGIDDVRGDLLPEDKVAAITELLQKYGAVGMVGDGVNDAPALAKATIGFAMGAAGTATALETADVR
jgi:Cd2+/Zn2+-exporting ATPase